jgi:hypothetical protein
MSAAKPYVPTKAIAGAVAGREATCIYIVVEPDQDGEPPTATLVVGIEQLFEHEPDRQWRDHIEAVAIKCARAADDDRG